MLTEKEMKNLKTETMDFQDSWLSSLEKKLCFLPVTTHRSYQHVGPGVLQALEL